MLLLVGFVVAMHFAWDYSPSSIGLTFAVLACLLLHAVDWFEDQ